MPEIHFNQGQKLRVQSDYKTQDNNHRLPIHESLQSFWNVFSEGKIQRRWQALVQVCGLHRSWYYRQIESKKEWVDYFPQLS